MNTVTDEQAGEGKSSRRAMSRAENFFEPRVFANPKEFRKNTNDRLNVEALMRYVPYFQAGEDVVKKFDGVPGVESSMSQSGALSFNFGAHDREVSDSVDDLTDTEKNYYETQIRLRNMAVEKIAALAGPLITREINKLLKNSHLSPDEQVFDVLFYAGVGGLIKGLRHFQADKINKSATNYLFQWISTYAEKELNVIEAEPFSIAPSRFKKYKKISAVRKRLTSQLERYATNDEVLEYFQSGRADIQTMSGPVKKKENPDGSGLFKSNQDITMELVKEQEDFEMNLNQVANIDPQDEYESSVAVANDNSESFDDTVFGAFVRAHNITPEARVVLLAEVSPSEIPDRDQKLIAEITRSNYHSIKNRWRDLLRDKRGPFYVFLVSLQSIPQAVNDYKFDIAETIENIEQYEKDIRPERWLPLFTGKKVEF